MYSLKIVCSIAIFLAALSNIYCITDAEASNLQQVISHLSEAQQQQIFQSLMANKDQGRQDNSNWCCSLDPGIVFSFLFILIHFH